MKLYKNCLLAFASLLFACQQPQGNKAIDTTNNTENGADSRPAEQVRFLNKVAAEADYDRQNAVAKDAHIKAFNKYALDSLKEIKNWEFIVDDINDNEFSSNTTAKNFFDLENVPVYNLVLVAPIKIDNSVDTISIDNRVDFTFTIPKHPKGEALKKILSIVNTLKKGDAVNVSGAVTYFDDNKKVNFAALYDSWQPWNVDLMITDIKKKQTAK